MTDPLYKEEVPVGDAESQIAGAVGRGGRCAILFTVDLLQSASPVVVGPARPLPR